MYELAKQQEHDRKVKEVAGDEPQIRDMSHQELIDQDPRARSPAWSLQDAAASSGGGRASSGILLVSSLFFCQSC